MVLGTCVLVIITLIVVSTLLARSTPWTHTELSVDQFASRNHLPVLDVIALTIKWLLAPVQGLVIVAAVSIGVFWKSQERVVSITFALVVSAGWLSSSVAKTLVHRARPDFRLLANPLSTEENFASFPSGHVALATALAVGCVLLLRRHPAQKWAIAIGAVGVTIVAWSRVYSGEHYPTDVLGSVIFTPSLMIAVLATWNHLLARHRTKPLDQPRRE